MAARRGNREGSIFRRADGRLAGQVSLGDGRRKTVYGHTRAEAAQKLAALIVDVRRGTVSQGDSVTVEAFLSRWLTDVVRPSVRPSTWKGYEQHVRGHIVPHVGRYRLSALTPSHVTAMMAALSSSNLSPTTVGKARSTLATALRHAERWGMVSRNVAALVLSPKKRRAEIVPFSVDEARAILAVTRDAWLGPLYHLSLSTGMRQGEALGLRWADVDEAAGLLHVRVGLYRVRVTKGGLPVPDTIPPNVVARCHGAYYFVEPKSARSRRVLPLPASVATRLAEHRARQDAARAVAGSRWTDTGLVFTTKIGTPLDGGYVAREFRAMLGAAGLPVRRWHDMRHSAASFLLAQGLSMRAVMEQLGHARISTTMDIYAHIAPEVLREAADKMDALLGQPPDAG